MFKLNWENFLSQLEVFAKQGILVLGQDWAFQYLLEINCYIK